MDKRQKIILMIKDADQKQLKCIYEFIKALLGHS